jgi:hypothetical protein
MEPTRKPSEQMDVTPYVAGAVVLLAGCHDQLTSITNRFYAEMRAYTESGADTEVPLWIVAYMAEVAADVFEALGRMSELDRKIARGEI